MEIPIETHKAALVAQQAEFDTALAAKEAIIASLQVKAAKDATIAKDANAKAAAEIIKLTAERNAHKVKSEARKVEREALKADIEKIKSAMDDPATLAKELQELKKSVKQKARDVAQAKFDEAKAKLDEAKAALE